MGSIGSGVFWALPILRTKSQAISTSAAQNLTFFLSVSCGSFREDIEQLGRMDCMQSDSSEDSNRLSCTVPNIAELWGVKCELKVRVKSLFLAPLQKQNSCSRTLNHWCQSGTVHFVLSKSCPEFGNVQTLAEWHWIKWYARVNVSQHKNRWEGSYNKPINTENIFSNRFTSTVSTCLSLWFQVGWHKCPEWAF